MCGAEKLGTSFALVRSDVGGNINRLKARQAAEPQTFALVFDIVLAEVAAGEQNGNSSATKGLLWLERCSTKGAPLSSSAWWTACFRSVLCYALHRRLGCSRGFRPPT